MRTFQSEDEAVQYMKNTNRARRKAGNKDIVVLVDGPADDDYTVMELREAIEADFLYRWEV